MTIMKGFSEIVGVGLPTLAIVNREPKIPFRTAVELLTILCKTIPKLHLAIFGVEKDIDSFLQAAGNSQTATMVREGRVDIASIDAQQIQQRLSTTANKCLASKSVDRLIELGVTETVLEEIEDIANSDSPPGNAIEEDRARSRAERFLFDLLESHPETVGFFYLNQRLEFRHGTQWAEGDLVSPKLRLAIEIDGLYFHLSDEKAYRRDRRKDWEYQRNGYLVLRFLAEDILPDMEVILDTIMSAVAFRKNAAVS
ncbi:DUF559 domain-containing protein [Telmatocola sphagniphila]|uniref:DUF559 domain-containing protein n=2 Tax=Telmatocola sphagniphila TaxID=1123043 RepID=A0A8E6EZQ6_9BACT|nr:DUF559 domain-containing protein [Telmatocola sphagniphila]